MSEALRTPMRKISVVPKLSCVPGRVLKSGYPAGVPKLWLWVEEVGMVVIAGGG